MEECNMKINKIAIYVTLVIVVLTTTGCPNVYLNEQGNPTQRGKAVYDAWSRTTFELFSAHNLNFGINALLNANSAEDTLLVHDKYFEGKKVLEVGRNTYGIYDYRTEEIVAIVQTDGNAFDKPGAEWDVVFNISGEPNSMVNAPNVSSPQKYSPIEPNMPPVTQYGENILVTSTFTADSVWNIQADLSSNPDLGHVDFSMKRIPLRVLGVFVGFEYHITGSGRYNYYSVGDSYAYRNRSESSNELHALVDFEIKKKFISDFPNASYYTAGNLDLKVSSVKDEQAFDVYCDILERDRMEITYAGVTTQWGTGTYYDPYYDWAY